MTSTLVSNIPPNLVRVFPKLYTVVGAMRLQLDQQDAEAPAPGDHSFAMRYPAGAGNATVIDVTEVRGLAPSEEHVAVTLGSPATTAVDLAELPLPVMTATPIEMSNTVDWLQTGAAAGDVRYVLWIGQKDGLNVLWTSIEDPAGPGSPSTLIPLPDAYIADDPTRNGAVPLPMQGLVAYVDYDNLDGFAEAREYGAELMNVAAMFLDVEHRAHFSQSP